jgi:Arc/MetJ-type ribon-helix-helix transcriptional regulator
MEIPLSEDLKQFIEIQVIEGRYPSHREVVEAALRRMQEQEAMLPTPKPHPGNEGPDQVNIVSHSPNESALAILQWVRERQEGRSVSDSTRTQDYLREARTGGMYGHGDVAGESTTESDD